MRRPVAADMEGAAAGKMKQRDREEKNPQSGETLGTGVDLLPGGKNSMYYCIKATEESIHPLINPLRYPDFRIVPIHMEGEEKPAAKTHQVPIKVTDRRGRSESRGRRDNSKGQVPVKVTYMEANANMQSKAFMDSNENCDAFTQTFQGDKRNNCVLS